MVVADRPAAAPVNVHAPDEVAPEPLIIVIFGATGDLSHRKLLPALYRLSARRLLPAQFATLGVARRDPGK